MSYDIDLFKPISGESVEEALARSFPESEEINPGPLVPEWEALKKHLASKLIEKNPELEIFKFGYKEVADMLGTSEEEAKLQWRHIELNGPEDGDGIQITIFDNTASITIPYWHKAEKAEAVFKNVWGYMEVFQSEAGYVAYDRQLERVLNLYSDLPDVLESYSKGMKVLEKYSDETQTKPQNPWWKFW